MKKIKYLLLITLLTIPFLVNAEEKFSIKSVDLVEKTDTTEVLEDPEIANDTVSLNLRMHELEDSITYNIKIENKTSETYTLNLINPEENYIKYEFEENKNNVKIKGNSAETVKVKMTYQNEVEKEAFRSGKYLNNQEIILEAQPYNIINPWLSPTSFNLSFILIGGNVANLGYPKSFISNIK